MSRETASNWVQVVLNIAVTLVMGGFGYWINLQDAKNASQDNAIAEHTGKIVALEKDTEYGHKAFESIDKKMETLLEKVDKLSNEVARLQP